MAKPPARALLFWKRLTSNELLLLLAMLELSGGTGEFIWPSIDRLAAYTKLDPRTIQRIIHGHKLNKGLLERGILSKLAPANGAKHRTVTYRLNLDALLDDPRMERYVVRQQSLPGMRHVPIDGEPITEPTPVAQCHPVSGVMPPHPVAQCHPPGGTVPPDSKAFDSMAIDSRTVIHHGDAALNSLPVWLSFKEQLRSELSEAEWNLWVRPMYLLKAMPLGDKKHLLAAIPPNGRIQQAALDRLPMMRSLLAPAGLNISLTRYPNEWEIAEAKKRYGVDIAPKTWARRGDA
jgi:hypothetical protein